MLNPRRVLSAETPVGYWGYLLPPLGGVEILRPHGVTKHDVVVEVNEELGEARDAMEVGFDGGGAVGRQVGLVGENVLEGAGREVQ